MAGKNPQHKDSILNHPDINHGNAAAKARLFFSACLPEFHLVLQPDCVDVAIVLQPCYNACTGLRRPNRRTSCSPRQNYIDK
jgi:hypothetical protein